VEAEVVVESVEDWVVWSLLGWLKEVVRERRRAVKGVGKGAGIRDITVGDDDGDEEEEDSSSIVVSRPSKKVMRSGTALVKVSVGMGGRRSMVLVLSTVVCIMEATVLLTTSSGLKQMLFGSG
jgi:hypothetical protein